MVVVMVRRQTRDAIHLDHLGCKEDEGRCDEGNTDYFNQYQLIVLPTPLSIQVKTGVMMA